MISSRIIANTPVDDLTAVIARKVMTTKSMILPFVDFTVFMTELLKTFYTSGCRLVGAGHVTPEIEIAANRAEIELVEALGNSPFSLDVESILAAIKSPHDLIYISNPNRITGANYSVSDLERLARAIPQGTMFIDEYYFDYFGVSGLPLLEILANVVILRSFTASFGINSSDTGFLLANGETINVAKDSCQGKPISSTVRKTILATLVNEEAMSLRLHEVREESLRLATALSRLKVQCQITTADFLLLRVANPKDVGNYLARYKTPVENLDGYPQLKNYLRYRIQSVYSNDRLLEAFKKMPPDYYRLKAIDRRPVKLPRPNSLSQGKKEGKEISGVSARGSYTGRRPEVTPNRKNVARK